MDPGCQGRSVCSVRSEVASVVPASDTPRRHTNGQIHSRAAALRHSARLPNVRSDFDRRARLGIAIAVDVMRAVGDDDVHPVVVSVDVIHDSAIRDLQREARLLAYRARNERACSQGIRATGAAYREQHPTGVPATAAEPTCSPLRLDADVDFRDQAPPVVIATVRHANLTVDFALLGLGRYFEAQAARVAGRRLGWRLGWGLSWRLCRWLSWRLCRWLGRRIS